MSSQGTFIYVALFSIQIVSKQLCSDTRKIMQQVCLLTADLQYNVIFSSISEMSLERDQLLHSQKRILPEGEFVYMLLLKYELLFDNFAKKLIHTYSYFIIGYTE